MRARAPSIIRPPAAALCSPSGPTRSAARSCRSSRSSPLTPHTTTEPDAIEAILAECRRRGFVEEVEENEVDAACVGAPLLDDKGEAIAAVSVAGPLTRMEAATRERVGALLVETLAEARRSLLQPSREGARAS